MSRSVLPDLIIAGMPKCGTTSLHQWLTSHPRIAGGDQKEIQYFMDPGATGYRPGDTYIENGIEGYCKHFSNGTTDDRRFIDVSPAYAFQRTALDTVPALPNEPLVVFIVRDPAEQLLSTYTYFSQNKTLIAPSMTFRNFVDDCRAGGSHLPPHDLIRNAVKNCEYSRILEPWRQALGPTRFVLFRFDDLRSKPADLLRFIADRLEIDPQGFRLEQLKPQNTSYLVRSRLLHKVVEKARSRVPDGLLYRQLRSAYRLLNTRASLAARGTSRDDDLATIGRHFARHNQELAASFGIDTSRWHGSAAE